MYLNHLQINNFKNLLNVNVECSPLINCLLGENGSGKTNLLDAIYYLCLTKSAFNITDNQSVNFLSTYFRIEGDWILNDKPLAVECAFSGETKKIFKVDGQEYEKLSNHIGLLPLVMMAPDDTDLIREGSETRRKFFDGIICQLDRDYLQDLISYQYILKQRNALLKKAAEITIGYDQFEPYDHHLLILGKKIALRREDTLLQFSRLFIEKYLFISSEKETPSLKYESDTLDDAFATIFRQAFQKDLQYQRTTKGIHTEDYEFKIDNNNLKKTASQGQKKSFVIALKLAQFEMIRLEKAVKPVLLLDDIFDKLDDNRIKKLIALIANDSFGQIFITDARPERSIQIFSTFGEKVKNFKMANGKLNN